MTTPCIVLAGGLGTRLRSAVPDLPKCLAPVGERPFLEIQLQALAAQGVDHFVLSLGHMADKVLDAVKRFDLAARVDSVVEPQPLGTGGAVLFALAETGLDEALVANGDTFLDASLAAMLRPLAADEAMRIATIEVPDRARYGGVELQGSRIAAFVEKGHQGAGLINAGLYRIRRSAFDGFALGQAVSMETQVMPALLARGALHAAVLAGGFIDIGVPEDYFRFCAEHADGR